MTKEFRHFCMKNGWEDRFSCTFWQKQRIIPPSDHKNVCFLFSQSSQSSVSVDTTYFRGAARQPVSHYHMYTISLFFVPESRKLMFLVFTVAIWTLFMTHASLHLIAHDSVRMCACVFSLNPLGGTLPVPSSWLQLQWKGLLSVLKKRTQPNLFAACPCG